MSVKTIYTCDRCGATQEKPEQFWVMTVQLEHYPACNSPATEKNAHWCRACCEVYGLLPTDTPQKVRKPEPGIEDILCEIVREEIDNAKLGGGE